MKKLFVAMMSVILVLMSSLSCAALETNAYDHENCEYSQIEFIFANADIDSKTAEIIMNKLSENGSTASTYGLTCNLFGHKYGDVEYVTTITHNARTTAPRCLMEDYECKVCSRCDHVEEILVYSEYISCC